MGCSRMTPVMQVGLHPPLWASSRPHVWKGLGKPRCSLLGTKQFRQVRETDAGHLHIRHALAEEGMCVAISL